MVGPTEPQTNWVLLEGKLIPTPNSFQNLGLVLFHFTFHFWFLKLRFWVYCLHMYRIIFSYALWEITPSLIQKTSKNFIGFFVSSISILLLLSKHAKPPFTVNVWLKTNLQIKFEKIKSIWRRVSYRDGALSSNSLFVQLNSWWDYWWWRIKC